MSAATPRRRRLTHPVAHRAEVPTAPKGGRVPGQPDPMAEETDAPLGHLLPIMPVQGVQP